MLKKTCKWQEFPLEIEVREMTELLLELFLFGPVDESQYVGGPFLLLLQIFTFVLSKY